jgi:hypothetical protein
MPCDVVRSPVSLEPARTRYAAGETVVARVLGVTSPVAVALLRVEHRPCANRAVVVAEAHLGVLSGSFELTIPPSALPTARGAVCALSYVLQARAGGVIARAGLEISAVAHAHLDHSVCWADRLISNWDARHFHIELSEAVLHGGGRIAGRVHRHGPWSEGAMAIVVRCSECWHSSAVPVRGIPQWRQSTLWEAEQTLVLDRDATWMPFGFDLPGELPPAVEARTIAWRHELVARRRVRHWFDEKAALTPLLHDHRGPDALAP